MPYPSPFESLMHTSSSKLFNLAFTLLIHTTLTIYDSESFESAVGFCKLPILCAPWLSASIHLSPSNCLSNRRPSFEWLGTHTCGVGRLWNAYLVRTDCLAIVFLIVVFPLVAFLCFYSFLIPLYPTFVQELDQVHSPGG